MKINKEAIKKKAEQINIPDKDEVLLKQIEQVKKRYPRAYRSIVRKLKKKFPDKEFIE